MEAKVRGRRLRIFKSWAISLLVCGITTFGIVSPAYAELDATSASRQGIGSIGHPYAGVEIACNSLVETTQAQFAAAKAEHDDLYERTAKVYIDTFVSAEVELNRVKYRVWQVLDGDEQRRMIEYQRAVLALAENDILGLAQLEESINDIREKIRGVVHKYIEEISTDGGINGRIGAKMPAGMEANFVLQLTVGRLQLDLVFKGEEVVDEFDVTVDQRISFSQLPTDPMTVDGHAQPEEIPLRLLEHNINTHGPKQIIEDDRRAIRRIWELRQIMDSLKRTIVQCGFDPSKLGKIVGPKFQYGSYDYDPGVLLSDPNGNATRFRSEFGPTKPSINPPQEREGDELQRDALGEKAVKPI